MEDAHSVVEEYTDQSLSTIHHVLRASRRRLVIGLVGYRTISSAQINQDSSPVSEDESATQPAVTVRQLAKEIVSIEDDVTLDHATGEPYHNVYTALIQTHLPELDDVGAVMYDSDRKTVKPDRNLVALAMAAAVTSPIAQILFHNAVSDSYAGENSSLSDSIGD